MLASYSREEEVRNVPLSVADLLTCCCLCADDLSAQHKRKGIGIRELIGVKSFPHKAAKRATSCARVYYLHFKRGFRQAVNAVPLSLGINIDIEREGREEMEATVAAFGWSKDCND